MLAPDNTPAVGQGLIRHRTDSPLAAYCTAAIRAASRSAWLASAAIPGSTGS